MKNLFAFISLMALLTFGAVNTVNALGIADGQEQVVNAADMEQTEAVDTTAQPADTVAKAEAPAPVLEAEEVIKKESFNQLLKRYFIQGDARFMAFVLLALILGLALVIERVIYLNLATTNTKKLLARIESSLASGGVESAKDICRDTRGPVASIFYQGLMRYDEGLESVEKSIIAYGSVAMAQLEKGLSWISLFIALAPMLGFMGTVIGMIQAFDKIEAVGDINPTVVAGGIKVALLTTVFGLIVAIILQIFYNYLVSKVDNLVNDMEDSSISFMDILAANKK
ncbi:MAG: MotA/TolQ/ExbB proton channel family protein [Bacteroidales bacterium]|nr:MotA/TolQ/ExbB proton channel family protein [Bacteroidales bacterium]